MRIISGKYKGRRLVPPARLNARPTTDMAREALFNVLKHEVDFAEAEVLDLFTGTGAISLEFISRGVKSATAIDIEYASKKFIDSVKKDWGVDNIRAVKADVFKVIKKINQSFDIVFADPPYDEPQYPDLPDMIFESGWVNEGGLLILEHGNEHNFEANPRFKSHRRYGDINFSFFRD